MDLKEQKFLRLRLKEVFPKKSSDDLNRMFQTLKDVKGATSGFYRVIGGQVTAIGVFLGNPNKRAYYKIEDGGSTLYYDD